MKGGLIKGHLLVATLVLAGCGATDFDTKMPETLGMQPGETIEFPGIENATGKSLDPPADEIFNEYMAELLHERRLLTTSVSQPAALVLKTKLIEYEPGNAAARWVLPGMGTSVCTVHAELLDKKTGAIKGSMESRQTVSFGGAYSIGADEYICKRVADELMEEIDEKLPVQEVSS